ncbi:MAG: hypothetical protein KTM48_01680 [Wolbachia endosymbiont of Pissodes strobi]|nr:hypothetical protein [Wolbachia endosymbiont of Pissodes strobi]
MGGKEGGRERERERERESNLESTRKIILDNVVYTKLYIQSPRILHCFSDCDL